MLCVALVPTCRSRQPESVTTSVRDLACEESKPIVLFGKHTGFERCSNSMRHRRNAVACASSLPRPDDGVSYLKRYVPEVYEWSQEVVEAGSWCLRDSDCSARVHGHCEPMRPCCGTYCAYGCLSDSECSDGEICLCDDPVGRCVPASCQTDADCQHPYVCGDYEPIDGECGVRDAFACQTARDECAVICGPRGIFCTFSEGHRTCADECGVY